MGGVSSQQLLVRVSRTKLRARDVSGQPDTFHFVFCFSGVVFFLVVGFLNTFFSFTYASTGWESCSCTSALANG